MKCIRKILKIAQQAKESYHLQAQYECLSTLHFVDLSRFTHCFLNDITVVVVVLGKKKGVHKKKQMVAMSNSCL